MNEWNSWHDCVDDSYEIDEDDFDCSFILGWGCPAIGSEDCEFECPYHRHLYAELNRVREISEQN